MLSLFVCVFAVGQVAIQEPMRLRTVLPSGAVVLVERIPSAQSLSVQLFAGTRGIEESPQTNGYRHLLEHLITRSDQALDTDLETQGAFLRPRTLRDASVFEVQAEPGQLALAFRAFGRIVHSPPSSQADIDREMRALREEGALRDSTSVLSEAAWRQVFGPRGGDPFGDLEAMAKATPPTLDAIKAKMFVQSNVAVVVAGNVDLDAATSQAKAFLEDLPAGKETSLPDRKIVSTGTVAAQTTGEAAAVPVGSYREPSTAATLAAALAIADTIQGSFVTYTPSAVHGLVIVGLTRRGPLLESIRAVVAEERFEVARLLARRWVERQLTGVSNIGFWRGLLLVQSRDLRPEVLLENIDTMTLEDFQMALAAFGSAKAVRVVGR
jgi:predicted Zn-dependent peptidase